MLEGNNYVLWKIIELDFQRCSYLQLSAMIKKLKYNITNKLMNI